MKITLIGYGKMGHEVESMALANKFEISSIIDHKEKNATHKELSKEAIENADVIIDFSSPNTIIETITKAASYKKPLVVGTTGWYDNLEIAKKIVANKEWFIVLIFL
jgi:4-hydroxy-tetrahydrodipicolinate reductase